MTGSIPHTSGSPRGAQADSVVTVSGPDPGHSQAGAAAGRPPLLESEALLQGHRTVEIHHQGVYYRLQATRQGKLILTK